MSDKSEPTVHRMVMAASLANVAAFVYGLSFGWMSPTVPLLQSAAAPGGAPLSDGVVSWMASCLSLGAALATPLFICTADRLGRKPALMLMSLAFAVSWAIKLVSARPGALIAARACAGLATGGVYLVIPIYVREISEDSIRGALGSIMMFACNLGVLAVYWLGTALSYRANLWLYLALPLVHVSLFCFMPESPAFDVKRGRLEAAARTVAWLRGVRETHPVVLKELELLQQEEQEARVASHITILAIVRQRGLRRALRLAFFTVTTETMSGCFAVIQYSALIFYRAAGGGGGGDGGEMWRPEHLSLFVGATQLLGSVLSIYAVERCGRKPLLITSMLVISCCMFTLGAWFILAARGWPVPGWLPVLAVCLSIFSYGAGLASVPFVIIAEIFSFQMRARLSGWVVGASWLVSTLTVLLFVPVASTLGDHVVFFTFGGITCAGALHTLLLVPETKNKSLAQIQREIEGKTAPASPPFQT